MANYFGKVCAKHPELNGERRSAGGCIECNRERGRGPRSKFHFQKARAASRGIAFLLTFDEWWLIWQQSGHWHQRGKGRGKYQMARFGDQGAYAVGNVKIISSEANRAEQQCTAETRERLRVSHLGHKPSAQVRAKMSAAALGRKKPPEVHVKMWATRRAKQMDVSA